MAEISIKQLRVSDFVTNCYILTNTQTKECIIIDPGDNAKYIAMTITELGVTPVAILLTHGHLDHIGAAQHLKAYYKIDVISSAAEEKIMADPMANLSSYFGDGYSMYPERTLQDGEAFECAGITIKMILTPGHTGGSCCYYLEENNVLFSGDTLFCASRGRTDFPTGSEATIIRSIKDKLLVLPGETVVYPGHMETTTIEDERKYY